MWLAWLAKRSSFSFQGKHGHLNLLREARARGSEGYWYAYRRQGKRRIKQYAGRTPDLTIARLEELAHTPDFLMNETHSIEQLPRGQEHSVHAVLPPGPLLASRLRPPPLPAAFIRRERLLALLEAGLEYRLTLLSAPAGSGKTTLLAQWLAA